MNSMITAPQPLAVDAGARVLADGGNAVDAAVTAAFVQMVVTPRSCGIGGFGMINLHLEETGQEMMLDFHGKAGSRVTPGMWQDLLIEEKQTGYGYTLENLVNERGYTAVTTPGTVAGLHKVQTEFGTMPWKDVIAPAIEVATGGFEIAAATAKEWQKPPIGSSKSPWATVRTSPFEGGGEFIANTEMARTFSVVAEGGAEVFYRGELAKQIAEDMERGGGFITLDDLSGYEVTVAEPVCANYRRFNIASNQPPGGGLTILQMLKILEGYDLAGMGHLSAEYIYKVSMAMRAAWVDRANLIGDPLFVDVPATDLLSDGRAAEWRARIDAGEIFQVPRWQPQESPDTTHVSVVDSSGNVMGLTHSLGSGADVVTEGLGFMYNNCMNCFNPIPDQVNSIVPGKSRTTGMAPTLVKIDDKPYFSVGAPGGTRIVTGIFHAILNVLDHEMTVTEAIAAPRFDSQGEVVVAHARISPSICDQVRQRGLEINRSLAAYGGIGSVHGIRISPTTNALDGGADPGDNGMALEVR